MRSLNSSVGIASRLQAERSAVRIPAGQRDFSLLQNTPFGSRPHPPGLLFNGYGIRGFFSGNKEAVASS